MTCTDIADIIFRCKPVHPESKLCGIWVVLPFVIFGTVYAGMGVHILIENDMNKFLVGCIVFALIMSNILFVALFWYIHDMACCEKPEKYESTLSEWENQQREKDQNELLKRSMQCRIDMLEAQLGLGAQLTLSYIDVVPKSSR
jgi:hypothetical protein